MKNSITLQKAIDELATRIPNGSLLSVTLADEFIKAITKHIDELSEMCTEKEKYIIQLESENKELRANNKRLRTKYDRRK